MSSNVIERLTVGEIKETMNAPVYQTNSFSLIDSSTFYVTSNPGITVALTDAELTTNGVITVSFISPNGSMEIPKTLTVNGTAYKIKWQLGQKPSQSLDTVQIITFSIITFNGAVAHVIGGKATYS